MLRTKIDESSYKWEEEGVVWKHRDYVLYSTNSSYHLDPLWFFFYIFSYNYTFQIILLRCTVVRVSLFSFNLLGEYVYLFSIIPWDNISTIMVYHSAW